MAEAPAYRTFFGDAEHDFRLTPPMVMELERQLSAGIGAIFKRLIASEFALKDVTETIRLGLIGGGTDPEEAHHLVTAYAAPAPLMTVYPLALSILEHLMFGPVKDTAK